MTTDTEEEDMLSEKEVSDLSEEEKEAYDALQYAADLEKRSKFAFAEEVFKNQPKKIGKYTIFAFPSKEENTAIIKFECEDEKALEVAKRVKEKCRF